MNGRNGLACMTPVSAVAKRGKLILRPLPGLPVIRDLVVDIRVGASGQSVDQGPKGEPGDECEQDCRRKDDPGALMWRIGQIGYLCEKVIHVHVG